MGADTHPVACSRHCQHFRQHNSLRTIAAVGDSITYGTCASDRARMAWPAQLQRGYLWQDPTVRVLNFGASGRTMSRSGDNPYWDDAEFDRAKASKADAFVIGLGTNDAKHQNWPMNCSLPDASAETCTVMQDYLALLDVAKTKGVGGKQPKLAVMTPPPLWKGPAVAAVAAKIEN